MLADGASRLRSVPPGTKPAVGVRARAGQPGQRDALKRSATAALRRHLPGVAEQAEAGDVGAGVEVVAQRAQRARRRRIERGHAGDRRGDDASSRRHRL